MWIRKKINIPLELNKKDREKLSDEIINFIIERSQAGYDKNNEKFAPYSKAYADFKGVSRNNVDLTLSSEMLEGLKLLQNKKGQITIGYDRNSELNGRAEGNIKGTYGNPTPITKPRDFLGIDDAMVEILAESINGEVLTQDEFENIDLDAEAKRIASEILGKDLFDS
jgi:hypothetical protein